MSEIALMNVSPAVEQGFDLAICDVKEGPAKLRSSRGSPRQNEASAGDEAQTKKG
ncbi:MAG: hypothetical protein WBN75_05680 [Verrucomicrobiia bacterium]|jgi:hypothetical protein